MALNDYLRTSSLDIYDSVSFKNLRQRSLYDSLLKGTAARADVGQEAVSGNLTARPPSWTQHAAGLSHGFVIPALSASSHETQVLNARLSGTVALESSPAPASGNVYYSKRSRLVTVTYKVTGSAGMTGVDSVNAVSGALITAGANQIFPFAVPFDVKERGKIVDIKVWVELINRSGSDPGVLGNLSCIGLALKSPNVFFGSSIPILNDKTLNATLGLTPYYFFNGSYLLWVGSQLDDAVIAEQDTGDDHYTWGRDRHMRVVFTDSAHPVDGNNPRNLASSHGGFFATLTASSPSKNYAGNSPNKQIVTGNDWPWISDARVQDGGNHGAAGSPPPGWLTGPGGTAAAVEWSTTGSNNGPATMKPMYPLLDTVMEEKCLESVLREATYGWSDASQRDTHIASRRGIRPGLRGTEAQGHWELLIVTQDAFSAVTVLRTYFRQARLELTIDVGQPVSRTLPRKLGTENRRSPKPIAIMSGAYNGAGDPALFGNATNKFRNIVYTMPKIDVGTTVGITDNTGSVGATDFAVFSRITGALATTYAGSNMAQARYQYLNNEFGTPFIPLSSGSGVDPGSEITVDHAARASVFDVLNPRTSVETAATLRAAVNVTRPVLQTRDRVSEITSGST